MRHCAEITTVHFTALVTVYNGAEERFVASVHHYELNDDCTM